LTSKTNHVGKRKLSWRLFTWYVCPSPKYELQYLTGTLYTMAPLYSPDFWAQFTKIHDSGCVQQLTCCSITTNICPLLQILHRSWVGGKKSQNSILAKYVILKYQLIEKLLDQMMGTQHWDEHSQYTGGKIWVISICIWERKVDLMCEEYKWVMWHDNGCHIHHTGRACHTQLHCARLM
jgi:hypothetical protein